MGADPIVSQTKMPSDDVPRRMLTLLLEMLHATPVVPLHVRSCAAGGRCKEELGNPDGQWRGWVRLLRVGSGGEVVRQAQCVR